jgi:hypothetical protein
MDTTTSTSTSTSSIGVVTGRDGTGKGSAAPDDDDDDNIDDDDDDDYVDDFVETKRRRLGSDGGGDEGRGATWSARRNLEFRRGGGGGGGGMGTGGDAPRNGVHATTIAAADGSRINAVTDTDDVRSGGRSISSSSSSSPPQRRWRSHQIAEDYISLASSMTLPPTRLGPFGYVPHAGQYPIEQVTTLGYLKSPLRRPQSIVERWNPYEISLFEGSLALYGKSFHTVSKCVGSKTTKEVVEFYYVWKKTSHGRRWKTSYVAEVDDESDGNDGDDDVVVVAVDRANADRGGDANVGGGEGRRNVVGESGGVDGGAPGGSRGRG